jgi:hypothetical protein
MRTKLVLLFVALFITTHLFAQQGFPFADEIRAFKKQDSLHFPPSNGILFIGSSSIRKWADLEERFPNKPIIRRGVGGCELEQLVDFYTSYILFPYHPKKIFIYAGDNDIASGVPAEHVADEFTRLWMLIHYKLPEGQIYFMSIKRCAARAKYYDEVDRANELIMTYLKDKPNSQFIDLNTIISKQGTQQPDSVLFEPDYIHLNKAGYDRWQKVLAPYID